MPITLWPSKTHGIKRAYGPFYCKPFPTVDVVLRPFKRVTLRPFAYLMLDVHPASDDRYRLWSHLTPREGQAQAHTLPVNVPAVRKRAATRTRTSTPAKRRRTTYCNIGPHGHPDPIASRRGLPLGATSHGYQQHDGHGDRIDQTGRSSPIGSRD